MKTAILIDGGFYKYLAHTHFGSASPKDRAAELVKYCRSHLCYQKSAPDDLYRIFYYDCFPIEKKLMHPLTKRTIDFSRTEEFKWNQEFLAELTKQRKFAMRLGRLSEVPNAAFNLKPDALKQLCSGQRQFEDLSEDDFRLNTRQKGVDMKIGVDIASLAYKRQVDRIILIAGDSDFVPAAKLARREGIDFILDPMWNPINPDLHEHIDGLTSQIHASSRGRKSIKYHRKKRN